MQQARHQDSGFPMNKPDYYSILGVSRSASDAEIKKAYRKLVMGLRIHCDKNNDPKISEQIKSIIEAYDVLSDGEKRAIFDQFGEEGLKRGGGGGGGSPNSSPSDDVDQMEKFSQSFKGKVPFAVILYSGGASEGGVVGEQQLSGSSGGAGGFGDEQLRSSADQAKQSEEECQSPNSCSNS